MTQINISDFKVDNSEKTLRIHGKGNKERLIYLDEAVCEAISKYLEVRPLLTTENTDYNALFLSSRNKRISNRAVQSIINDELNETLNNKTQGYHTHTLRHTSATLMYNENNVDIFILKKILGHKSIVPTEIYTHVTDKKLKEIMQNCTISSILEREGSNVV